MDHVHGLNELYVCSLALHANYLNKFKALYVTHHCQTDLTVKCEPRVWE